MDKQKKRLDQLLVDKGYFSSREKAKRSIMAGEVYIDQQKAEKAGQKYLSDVSIYVKEGSAKFVSRGGFKLEKALQYFKVQVKNRVVLDVGASTGGFTDCLLQHEAKLVHALDVGYGQLAWKLRQDPRVIVWERTNIRNVNIDIFSPPPSIATVDASFISLRSIFPNLKEILVFPAEVIALIKPQFEVGQDKIGKKGVVKNSSHHYEAICTLTDYIQNYCHYFLADITFSPLIGPEGNIEYLAYFLNASNVRMLPSQIHTNTIVQNQVKKAFKYHKGGTS